MPKQTHGLWRGPRRRSVGEQNRPICSYFQPRVHVYAHAECCPFAARDPSIRAYIDNKNASLQALRETGATGLEPATSGVTGRVGHHDAPRRTPLNGIICRHFSYRDRLRSAWLSHMSSRRLGHEWATKSCPRRQRGGPAVAWASETVSIRSRSCPNRRSACLVGALAEGEQCHSRVARAPYGLVGKAERDDLVPVASRVTGRRRPLLPVGPRSEWP